jgi:RNA polymerase sigma-70 factor (ECF subfamily)
MAGLGRDEAAWIRGAQAGSVSELEALFRAQWPRAYRVAYLIVQDHAGAEDIAQEAFLSAVRHLDRFDRDRPFGPWLHRIVANRAIDWARARQARREVAGESYLEPVDPTTLDAEIPYAGETARMLAGGLAVLPPEQRAVIVLRYLLQYTPGEIAELLDVPRGTVNSRLRRGLDAMQVFVEEKR